MTNARYALNAANARWGSLYDALYGSDAIDENDGAGRAGGYNPKRGARVIACARDFLDKAAPLEHGSHRDATGYAIEGGRLVVTLGDGVVTRPRRSRPARGISGRAPGAVRDAAGQSRSAYRHPHRPRPPHRRGTTPPGYGTSSSKSALTTIQDCEDSVAAVDAEDKVAAYRNWLGLMKGTLTARFDKGGRTVERRLNADRAYVTPDGGALTLPGRSLMLTRNVGHLMTLDAVRLATARRRPRGSSTPWSPP